MLPRMVTGKSVLMSNNQKKEMTMKRFNSVSLAVFSTLAAACAFSSCSKEVLNDNSIDSRFVTLSVSTETGVETKAVAQSSEMVDLSENGFDLFVSASVSVNNEDPFSAVETKGQVITNDNKDKIITEFPLLMTGKETLSGIAKPYDSDHWCMYDGTTKVEWPEDGGEYTFIANYLAEGAGTFDASTLEYVGIAGNKEGNNAAKMCDFLVANTTMTHDCQTYHNPETYVKIHFYHALAAVRFNFEGATVTRIMINNIKKDGTIVLNEESTDPDRITWKDQSGNVSYTQDCSTTSSVDERTFFLVPQTLDENSTITFEMLDENKNPRSITAQASKLGVSKWEAGYIYNYTISTTATQGLIEVEASKETVVSNVRSGSAYVRAAVIGNWVDSKGRVVEDWDGTLENNGSWVKIGDYYYTTSPIFGFNQSEALVKSFTEGTSHDGKTLKVNMLVQALAWSEDKSNLTTAWGLTGDDLAEIGLN